MNWITPVTLQGDYVTLTPLNINDYSDLIAAAKDGELWKLWFASVPVPEEMKNEIQRRLDLQEQGLMVPFTVIDNKTKQAIGMTTYCNIAQEHKRLEIGWTWYRKSMQRTAVNTESKLLLLTHAFESLQCNVVRFNANYFNHASCKAIERLGAKFDGILRNNRILKNGMISDDCTYSIIKSEWPIVKTSLQWKLNSNYSLNEKI